MARKPGPIVKLVPASPAATDELARKLDALAVKIADQLLADEGAVTTLDDRIDGLKALSGYWQASRKGVQIGPPPTNAFDAYRKEQET